MPQLNNNMPVNRNKVTRLCLHPSYLVILTFLIDSSAIIASYATACHRRQLVLTIDWIQLTETPLR